MHLYIYFHLNFISWPNWGKAEIKYYFVCPRLLMTWFLVHLTIPNMDARYSFVYPAAPPWVFSPISKCAEIENIAKTNKLLNDKF